MKRASKSASQSRGGDLGVREELFLTEYIKSGGNGTQLVLRAGLTDSPTYAAVLANRLIRNDKILRRIDEWRETIQIEQREALGRLAQIARGSLEDFFTIDENGQVLHDFRGAYEVGALSNLKRLDTTVSTYTTGDGASEEVTRTEMEMNSPVEAIRLMSPILGWEKQPQQSPSESALVLSYVRKAA